MLDLTAEEGLIVDLWVERPGEQGTHLHGAIAARCVTMSQEVDRLSAVHPAGKLAAHHRLWDVLSGRLQEDTGVLGQTTGGALRGKMPSPVLGIKQRQGPLHLGVVQIPM